MKETRSRRDLYVEGLDALLGGRMAAVAVARDWELLAEIARLARSDAPVALAMTDPALFERWRRAVTRFHQGGWTQMTPDRVAEVAAAAERSGAEAPAEFAAGDR